MQALAGEGRVVLKGRVEALIMSRPEGAQGTPQDGNEAPAASAAREQAMNERKCTKCISDAFQTENGNA
jgi:hypothetical protein